MKKFDEYECDRAEKEKITNELQKNVNDMSAKIESLKGCLDRQEQYPSKVCTPPPLSAGRVEPPSKFSKSGGLDRTLIFRGGW